MDTPFRDFAGSTVVHTVGGMVALTGAIALGPRLGRKFKRDGGGMLPGHDMTIAAVGGVILWFGWYGFNPGSTLSAMDFEGIGRVATNTTLAAVCRWSGRHVLGLPRSQEVGHRHHRQRVPGRARRHHLPLLLGRPARRDHHRRHRRRGRGASASTSSSGSGSTIPSVPWRSTASAASGARSASGCSPPASSASPARPGADTVDRSRSTASSTAAAPTSWSPRSSAAR